MPTHCLIVATAAVALLGANTSFAQRRVPESVVLETDVEYGRADDRPLRLDIARPRRPAAERLPVIVMIHGGGWSGGDKSVVHRDLVRYAATGNYFCVTVEYRLSGEAAWPAQIHDCKAAVRWLRASADKYSIDPDRIGAWGASAGGHLAAMLGVSGDVAELEGDCGWPGHSSRVACAVDFCGPSELFSFFEATRDGRITRVLGGPIEQHRAAARSASPVTHVSKDDPPLLIVHGTDDAVVPYDQAEKLHAALEAAGGDSTLVKVVGANHHQLRGREVNGRVQAFFEKHLRGQDVVVSGEPIRSEQAAGNRSGGSR